MNKEKYLNGHSSVISDTSDSTSMYCVPILSTTSSPANESFLQSEENVAVLCRCISKQTALENLNLGIWAW